MGVLQGTQAVPARAFIRPQEGVWSLDVESDDA